MPHSLCRQPVCPPCTVLGNAIVCDPPPRLIPLPYAAAPVSHLCLPRTPTQQQPQCQMVSNLFFVAEVPQPPGAAGPSDCFVGRPRRSADPFLSAATVPALPPPGPCPPILHHTFHTFTPPDPFPPIPVTVAAPPGARGRAAGLGGGWLPQPHPPALHSAAERGGGTEDACGPTPDPHAEEGGGIGRWGVGLRPAAANPNW